MIARSALALVLALAWPGPAPAAPERGLALFGGPSVVTVVWREETLPLVADHGGQYQVGIALTETLHRLPRRLSLDGEVGLALRHDDDAFDRSGISAEVWAGPALRHDGIHLGAIVLRPALTVGFSTVSASRGLERANERDNHGDAAFLYFMAPELALSFAGRPEFEFVYRGQHRSGGKNVNLPPLGNMGDANNANVFGIHWRF